MLQEIRQLTAILQAEVEGRDIDRQQARYLARVVATRFPACAQSMWRVVARMSDENGVTPSILSANEPRTDPPLMHC